MTPEAGAAMVAVISALSKPRADPPTSDGAPVAEGQRDGRSLEQRQHDAMGEVCARALRAGGLAESGGVPASVIVTIAVDDLLDRTGAGETSFGNPVSMEQLLRLAGEADLYPVVLTGSGQPLWLGRTRRIASRSQSMALIARDGGCSFPGCAHPPQWCDRHHVVGWVDGGLTDLDNLTLLCRYHHTRFVGKGWTCRINPEGIPEWIPPRWQDPSQTPMIHHRILRLQLQRRIRARSRRPELTFDLQLGTHDPVDSRGAGGSSTAEVSGEGWLDDGGWAEDAPGSGPAPVGAEWEVDPELGVDPVLGADPELDQLARWRPTEGPTDRWAAA